MGHLVSRLLLFLAAGLVGAFVLPHAAYVGQKSQSALSCTCGSGPSYERCCGSKTLQNHQHATLLGCPCGSGVPFELCCGGLAPQQPPLTQKPVVMSTCPCGSDIPYEDCCGQPLFGNSAKKNKLMLA